MFGIQRIKHRRKLKQEFNESNMQKLGNRKSEYVIFVKANSSQTGIQYKVVTAKSYKRFFHKTISVSPDDLQLRPKYWLNKEEIMKIEPKLIKGAMSFVIIPVNLIKKISAKILNNMTWFEQGIRKTLKLNTEIKDKKKSRFIVNKQIERNVSFINQYIRHPLTNKAKDKLFSQKYIAVITSNQANHYFLLTPKYHYYGQGLPVVPPSRFKKFAITYSQLIQIRRDMLNQHWLVSPVIIPVDTKLDLLWKQVSKIVHIETSGVCFSMVEDKKNKHKTNLIANQILTKVPLQIKRDAFLLTANYLL